MSGTLHHAMHSSNLYTISPNRPFADVLAAGLLARANGNPHELAQMRLLLPSRRAIRSVQEAFLRTSNGRPLLLPHMQAIGDVDEEELLLTGEGFIADIPPPISASRRILLLATLIWQFRKKAYYEFATFEQSVELAKELARFLDEIQREELSIHNLPSLVTGELARHWEITVDFLQILIRQWPVILQEYGCIDPVEHRNCLLHWLAERWMQKPPSTPVIAAGTTGSMPATARLLKVIAALPQGMVILPALDLTMEETEWEMLEETHPQWGMAHLLAGMGYSRAHVQEFDAEPQETKRVTFLKTALKPSDATDSWRKIQMNWQEALAGCVSIDCTTIQQEATTVALLLRDALEMPGKTAALVTPNRELARRVSAILKRFHVEIDDSAGIPVTKIPAGIFLQLLIDAVLEKAAPVPLLALMKHPFAQLGLRSGHAHHLIRQVEKYILRGIRLSEGIDTLLREIQLNSILKQDAAVVSLIERIAKNMAPLAESSSATFADFLKAHIAAAEAFSLDEEGRITLWDGEDGEVLLAHLHEIAESAEVISAYPLSLRSYAITLQNLLQGKAYRPRFGTHPRLHILSPMESRLQRFDRVVLSSLNEGSWPEAGPHDPWLSRPMRKDFALSQPERQIGLSAHDFYLLAASPEIFLTRSDKEKGAATVPSRWLLRLEAVLGVIGGEKARQTWKTMGKSWSSWAAKLDHKSESAPWHPPSPKPPLETRPRTLFVTRVETLLRNPYGLYASHILGLRKLDPLDKEPSGAEFGNLVHEALEKYIERKIPGLETLLACGREAFEPMANRPSVAAIWWPRFEKIAVWIIELEATVQSPSSIGTEAEIGMDWQLPCGMFTLKSRADRLETYTDGTVRLIDYKTGKVFSSQENLAKGIDCQLLLGGAILLANGFSLEDLQYWNVKGGRKANTITSLKTLIEQKKVDYPSLEAWIRAVAENIRHYIAGYDDPSTPYLYCPIAEYAPKYNDYEHLARAAEWGGEI